MLDQWNSDPDKIKNLTTENFIDYLEGLENVDFTKEGKYGGVGSAGTMNKIKEDLVENVNIFGFDNFSEFENDYKQNYLPKFKSWTRDNLKSM